MHIFIEYNKECTPLDVISFLFINIHWWQRRQWFVVTSIDKALKYIIKTLKVYKSALSYISLRKKLRVYHSRIYSLTTIQCKLCVI